MSPPTPGTSAPLTFRAGPFLLGLALVTGTTLGLEVTDTRLLSVITWYSLAFLVIAMGLFGLTAGAVHVYLRPAAFEGDRLVPSLARHSRYFALAIPVSLALLLAVPLTTAPVFTTVALFVLFAACLALPFYPAGIVVAAALTRTKLPVGRVYAVDLLGAAAGAPLVAALIRLAGGETAILLLGVVAALGSLAFAYAAGDSAAIRKGFRVTAALALFSAANAVTPLGLRPIWVKGRLDVHEFASETWNSHSRVRMYDRAVLPAMLWGNGSECTPPNIAQHVIEIDAAAGTTLYEASPDLHELGFLLCDVTNVAAQLRPTGGAAIIGVGGSRDLQAALATGHAPVYGIEFNDRILELLHGPTGRLSSVPGNPAVRLVEAEGRSYMARSHDTFSLVQASLVDTWAATGAGAHALGENGLYTVEAFRTFMDRLSPDGVLTVSRWTQETARLLSLSIGALIDRGVADPRRQLAFLSTTTVITVIVGNRPFTAEDDAKLAAIAAERGFLFVGPDAPVSSPGLAAILGAKTRDDLERATELPGADYRPPTDDRPYFFNVLPVEAAFRRITLTNMGSIEGNLLATRTLVLSFLASLVLVTGAIALPLLLRPRSGSASGRSLAAALAYFLLIGVGFMLAEVALLQRLGLLLGNPSYSLVVVITSLVGGTGLGSLASDRLPLTRAPFCFVYPLVVAAALAVAALAWPALALRVLPAPDATRIGFAVLVTAGLGVLLGVAFPAGLRVVSRILPEQTPWFWGINGIGSVLASSAAVMVAERYGLTATVLAAAGCYALLVLPITVLVREPAKR